MDKRTKVRNIIIITALTVALIAFSYAFSDDWISVGIFTACIVFPVLILLDGSLTKVERSRIFVIYIVAFFVIFFWAAYEQAGASLTLFASEQTDRSIFGWEMPASWFQSFNPLFVVILAYIMPGIWGFLNKRNMEPASPTKQAIGLLLLSWLSLHLFWSERCYSRSKGEHDLADRTLFYSYNGRNRSVTYRAFYG